MPRFDTWEDEHEHAMHTRNRALHDAAACTPDYDPDPSDFWCDCDDPSCRASHDDCTCPAACERHETSHCQWCERVAPTEKFASLEHNEKWCPACVLEAWEADLGDWDLSDYVEELARHGVWLPNAPAVAAAAVEAAE